MDLLDHLRNLLVMAVADGSLTEREIKFLSDRTEKWSISESDFVAAIEYALSDDAALVLPATKPQRIEMLTDLMRMMAADGDLSNVEKQLFAASAAKMEISDEELNTIIDSVV